ncbi:MAG TPA: phosphoglycerate dehydrogenase [Actinomycetota bacterium]|nr:phosphoglycerate dehydrogenase [Actinomycetota bacterium]
MKVLVAEPIADAGIDALRAAFDVDVITDLTHERLLEVIEAYDAIIVRSATKVGADVIERGRSLKVIGRAGIGVDNVDVEAATRHGILVVNAPQSNIVSAAEHAMALLLSQARNIPQANASLKSGKWERSKFEGVELHGKTLAVLGLGRIGSLVAQRALAFGMKIVAYDPYVSKARAAQMGVELVPTIQDALRIADFVTIHLPKTKETAGAIGAEELALCKPNARIINAARGGIVDEQALADAVRAGKLGGAGFDVFAEEPTTSSPLFELDGIVVTPHLGASTTEAQDKAGATIAEQVLLALRGDLAPYAVNVDVGREISDAVKPFLGLAEKLGAIFTHIGGSALHKVQITYQGQIASHETRVLTLSVLKGMLSAVVHEPVTFVNAPLMAAERGIEYVEMKETTGRDYVNQMEIRGEGDVVVSGTVVGVRNEERLTGVYDFPIDMPPGRHMCFLRYDDRPGVIGTIGTILGGRGINIADMRVGRRDKGGEALMALAVDQPMTPEVLAELQKGSGAKDARFIELTA